MMMDQVRFQAKADKCEVMSYLRENAYQYLVDNDLLKFVCVRRIHAHHNPHVDLKTGMCSTLPLEVRGLDSNVHQKNCHIRKTRDGERPTRQLLEHILETAEHKLNIDDTLLEHMQAEYDKVQLQEQNKRRKTS